MRPTYEQLTRECDEALASLDASLAKCAEPLPGLDPDTEAMITAPAATVAGSVNLLDATMAALHRPAPLLKPTCDEAGHWRYVPAAEIDGPRVPTEAVAAVNLDPLLYAAVASALNVPVDAARAAVEGTVADGVAA